MKTPAKTRAIASVLTVLLWLLCFSVCLPIVGQSKETVFEEENQAEEIAKRWNGESYRRSIALYNQAAEKFLTLNEMANAVRCWRESSRLELLLGNYDSAVETLFRSLRILDSDRLGAEKATTQAMLSLLFIRKGDAAKSKKYLDASLQTSRSSRDAAAQATAFFSAAEYFYYRSEFVKAADFYRQSANLWKATDNSRSRAETLVAYGYVFMTLGKQSEGLNLIKEAEAEFSRLADQRGIAVSQIAQGHLLASLKKNQAALESYLKAAAAFPENLDLIEKARLNNGIGSIYQDYGEWELSLSYRQKALSLFQKENYFYGELATLHSLIKLSFLLGKSQDAIDYFTRVQKLSSKLGENYFLALSFRHLGDFYFQNLKDDKAVQYYQKSLDVSQKVGYQTNAALILDKFGSIYKRKNQSEIAGQYYHSSLAVSRRIANKFSEAQTLHNLAELQIFLKNEPQALDSINQSIQITESLSSDVLSYKLKTTYFSNVFDRYELYVNLLIKMHRQFPKKGFDVEALQAVEKSRARSMLEKLSLSESDFTKDAAPEVVKREKEIRVLLNSKADKLTDLLSSNAGKSETDKLDSEINELENELEEVKATLKQNSPVYSAIKNPAPFDVGEFQRDVLDENSVLLEFSFGNEESCLWLVGKDEISSHVLPPRERIESRIENLRKLIDSRGMLEGETVENYQARINEAENTYKLESKQLSDELFGQVADKLSGKRLIIVPDGKLHYFPAAALPFPNSKDDAPILLTNETIYEPSAATLALLVRNNRKPSAATKNLLIFSDPIFSNQDARITADAIKAEIQVESDLLKVENFRFAESLTSLVRLNASKDEADSIVEIVGESASTALSGAAATRERALDASIADYRIVHFATHGLIKEDRPELSGIVLSQVDQNGQTLNGVVRLQDIYAMNLTADAVILSACSTGIGKEVKGEGLMSLNNAFLQTGAKSVVSSLWKVDDYAAQELMKNFYRELASGTVTTSEALRRAQIKLREDPQYQSPFYWAAFTVQGDYKTVPQLSKGFDYRIFGLLIFPFALLAIYVYRRRLNHSTVKL